MLLNQLDSQIDSSVFRDATNPVNNKLSWEGVKTLLNKLIWDWYEGLDAETKNHEIYTFKKFFISYTLRIGDLDKILPFIVGNRGYYGAKIN